MATHSSIVAWKIAWTEEPGGLQSMELQRVKHNLATKLKQQPVLFVNQLSIQSLPHLTPHLIEQV